MGQDTFGAMNKGDSRGVDIEDIVVTKSGRVWMVVEATARLGETSYMLELPRIGGTLTGQLECPVMRCRVLEKDIVGRASPEKSLAFLEQIDALRMEKA